MITLFGCAHFFNFVSFLLYPTEVKRIKCPMLGAFTVLTFAVTCSAWSSISPCLSAGSVLNRVSGSTDSPTVFFCCLPTAPILPGNGNLLS